MSVVVPARDAAAHLPDAFGSLARQGPGGGDLGDDLEVVVVDDGSVDDTAEALEDAGSRLARLDVARHPVPRGVSAARNHGVRRATGRWVTFLDPDDWFYPGHLAAMLRSADRHAGSAGGVDFLVCDQVRARGRDRRVVRAPEPRREAVLDPRTGIMPTTRSTLVNYVQVSSRFLSRRVVDDGLAVFDEDLPTAEDREWAWRLLLGTSAYAVADSPGYVYRRQVAGSLTDIGDARQLGFLAAYDAVLDRLRAAGLPEYEPKALRDVLVVLHHHVRRRGAYPDDVRAQMVTRANALVSRFDRDVVVAQAARIGHDRAAAVRRQGVHL